MKDVDGYLEIRENDGASRSVMFLTEDRIRLERYANCKAWRCTWRGKALPRTSVCVPAAMTSDAVSIPLRYLP